jgi:hypothetical protein
MVFMNERIQELSAIAKHLSIDEAIHFSRVHNRTLSLDEEQEIFTEKFAELIVGECMNAVCDPSTTYLESMTDASAMYAARERIRKHFRS